MTSPTPPAEPVYADRTFRSPAGMVGGVLLLLLICWIGGDAALRGEGRVPWLALAGLLTAVPMVVAFTLRPVVLANEHRIRIRNPFRTISMPWTEVSDLRAGYSCELFTEGGAKYQLWAVPVSLRQRKKAARQQSRRSLDDPYDRTSVHADVRDTKARMATADQTMADLRELAERAKTGGAAAGESAGSSVSVRWAFEVIAPTVVGALLLVVLLATG
ncbi:MULTISPECIES: PH domain-containing protein [unclassified Streptomyces]|uniref:PH domain-containing protein n=1 Tax=unclassified Streptomyces TaxID=2593676 RepID=UPI00225B3095|nr:MULTISPECIES: PH domain-containing protein [unclassified Streptomyces]WSG52937.1 PH domain-containing protein [Streptomyces sp. NBC_01732]MCX5102940.1 PH domain-containing protein [Streptomyces sp. NBC_00439]MCX5162506.1 PH domain-containing protein [Streptomyces sp. NBC_00305]MCX5221023.1 PH domain-containing protein [Streptomyces sp. NBC_00264]WSC28118.1 PH domain-containing protein [Streptomyces sp. NBC_01768]